MTSKKQEKDTKSKDKVDKQSVNKEKTALKAEPKTMDELLALTGQALIGLRRGQVLDGTVTQITSKEILIDIGHKSEGIISGKELDIFSGFIRRLKVGDVIPVFVATPEDDEGQIILSLRRAAGDYKWKAVEEKKEREEPVVAVGVEVNRGGLIVEVEGVRGFIPASQLNTSRMGRAQDLIGQRVTAKVIEIDKKQNRLILSEREVVDKETRKKREELLGKIKVGETYEATVSGIAQFGIFVTVEGLEGLVHISEISWDKVTNPSALFKVGDKTQVKVIGIDEKEGRLNLSIKQLSKDPWLGEIKDLEPGQEVKGKVSRITTFGVFVNIRPGVDGLVHVSKLMPEENLEIGQSVVCIIDSIEPEQRRIGLSLLPTTTLGIYK